MKTLLLMFILLGQSCATQEQREEQIVRMTVTKAVSDLHSSTFHKLEGLITIEDKKDEIKITTLIKGLPPHVPVKVGIYEEGICMGNYTTAGDSYDKFSINRKLPQTLSDEKGNMKQVITVPKYNKEEINYLIGRSIVVNENSERIACGLIKPVNVL